MPLYHMKEIWTPLNFIKIKFFKNENSEILDHGDGSDGFLARFTHYETMRTVPVVPLIVGSLH